jgi:hypothetical protein
VALIYIRNLMKILVTGTHWKLSFVMYPPREKAKNQIITTAAAPMNNPVPFETGSGAMGMMQR